MCYSTTLRKEEKEIVEITNKKFTNPILFTPYYHNNGFEHKPLYIIGMETPEAISAATWGLVPSFGLGNIPEFYKSYNTLNAKSETLFTSNTFKPSVFTKRCLILADGFHEPHHINGTPYPYFCHYKDDSLFYFAGLYTDLGEGHYSCSIITMPANEQFKYIHNKKQRQPLILDKNVEQEWLNTNLNEGMIKSILKEGFTTKTIEAYSVSKKIYQKNNDANSILAITKSQHPSAQGSLF